MRVSACGGCCCCRAGCAVDGAEGYSWRCRRWIRREDFGVGDCSVDMVCKPRTCESLFRLLLHFGVWQLTPSRNLHQRPHPFALGHRHTWFRDSLSGSQSYESLASMNIHLPDLDSKGAVFRDSFDTCIVNYLRSRRRTVQPA